MKRSIGSTHTLYPTIQLRQRAQADCYRCGTRKLAQHLIWMKHPVEGAYLALCAACHPRYGEATKALCRARALAHNVNVAWHAGHVAQAAS